MRRTIVVFVVASCLGRAHAQSFADRLGVADEKIAAEQWHEALEVILPLQDQAARDEDSEALADRLTAVGAGLAGEDLDAALQAHTAALAMLQRRYGERDDEDVAAALNRVAAALSSLGRADEALQSSKAGLAMYQRLYGGGDHQNLVRNRNNVATCLWSLGRAGEALPYYESALAMLERMHADQDDPDVASARNNLASCLDSLGRSGEALPHFEAALTVWQRLHGDRDHEDVARGLNNVAVCLRSLGRMDAALERAQQALAMRRRLYADRDHPELATSLTNVANCQFSLGRADEALVGFESALAMDRRLYKDRDHPDSARGFVNLAACLDALGRAQEALPQHESGLAMWKRLLADRDHPELAVGIDNYAACLMSLGRTAEALPLFEATLAMRRRLFGEGAHPDVVLSLNNVASCLENLGRAADALSLFESALAMAKALHGDADHPAVALAIGNLAHCLHLLGRRDEALPHFESALAMRRRLYGDRDHPDVAAGLHSVAACLQGLGREQEALPLHESALAMRQRIFADRDHGDIAMSHYGIAACLLTAGRAAEALPQFESALSMWQRLFGDCDHPDLVRCLGGVALGLQRLGRTAEALASGEQATAMIERLRNDARASPELRQSFFEGLKQDGVFERLQLLDQQAGRAPAALHAAERSRGRQLLDALEQLGDPEAEAVRRARLRGDEAAATRLLALRADLDAARTESDRLLHELTRLDDRTDSAARDARRAVLLGQSNEVNTKLRQLLDERARLLGDVLPVGRVSTAAEIQAALHADELLLEFTVTKDVALLYVVAREGEVQAIELPKAFAAVQRDLPQVMERGSHAQLRGRDADAGTKTSGAVDAASQRLFASLIPPPVWERIRAAKHLFVAAHRELHRLPFELLVTDVADGKPVYWLDRGPPISYVPSGTLLHWLRHRAKEASDDTTSLDLLAVGDPSKLAAEPEVPEQGVFVVAVNEGGEGARIGLLPGDVLTSYDGRPLADDKSLRDARMEIEKAVEDGKRDKVPIPMEVWRRGQVQRIEATPGLLGISVGPGRARLAAAAAVSGDARMERITRAGDLERIGQLPPLLGARAETAAIEEVFAARHARTMRLLGPAATEPAVFDLAAKAKYLHFACHGIAEEYAGQSLSMLVLAQPEHVLPGDDGLLKLGDLLNAWRGRLASCRLVVLSACRTNVGPTLRDEAPQALPLGFLFAGAPAVISSLWPVDDVSTKELMSDFYARLLGGETDKLAAFTAARLALRQKHPDPFYWAPFLFTGAPE